MIELHCVSFIQFKELLILLSYPIFIVTKSYKYIYILHT